MIKSGFEKFQEQCRYCQYTVGTDIKAVDCSCIITHHIHVCTHESNQFEEDGEKYVLKCRLFRCPFYSEKERNDDYVNTISRLMSCLKWKAEHEDESNSFKYEINESAINCCKDYKALYKQLPHKQFEVFYSQERTLLTPIPKPNKE